MKYFTFFRQNDDFQDIVNDNQILKKIRTKIHWRQHLLLGFNEYEDGVEPLISYIILVYGDSIIDRVNPDRAPIPGVDYTPKKDKNIFKKVKTIS